MSETFFNDLRAWLEMNAAWLGALASLVTIAGVLYGMRKLFPRNKRSEPSALAIQRFQTIWSELSKSLHQDLKKSRDSALEAIRAADDDVLTHLRNFPNTKLYDLHWSEIVAYDPTFAKSLQSYGMLAQALNHAKHEHDNLKYKNEPDRFALEQAKSEMSKAAHQLADLIEQSLMPQVQRHDNLLLEREK